MCKPVCVDTVLGCGVRAGATGTRLTLLYLSHTLAPSPCPLPLEQVLGFQMDKNKKFRMSEELSEKNIKAFAQSVLDGTAAVSAPPG